MEDRLCWRPRGRRVVVIGISSYLHAHLIANYIPAIRELNIFYYSRHYWISYSYYIYYIVVVVVVRIPSFSIAHRSSSL